MPKRPLLPLHPVTGPQETALLSKGTMGRAEKEEALCILTQKANVNQIHHQEVIWRLYGGLLPENSHSPNSLFDTRVLSWDLLIGSEHHRAPPLCGRACTGFCMRIRRAERDVEESTVNQDALLQRSRVRAWLGEQNV